MKFFILSLKDSSEVTDKVSASETFVLKVDDEGLSVSTKETMIHDFTETIKNMFRCFNACIEMGNETVINNTTYSKDLTWNERVNLCVSAALKIYYRFSLIDAQEETAYI